MLSPVNTKRGEHHTDDQTPRHHDGSPHNQEERTTLEETELDVNIAKGYAAEAKDIAYKSRDNLNAAAANFVTNIETTLAMIMVLNAGIVDPKDRIGYGFGIISIFFSYLVSYLMSDQPFFKGLSIIQVYIIQYQINQYGKTSLYFTVMLAGIIMIGLTTAKIYRINKVTPHCILIGLKVSIGRFS